MNAPSTLEFALAGLIRQKPQSGYDLRKTFSTTAMRHFSDSPGSIYPALRRLEARGWIVAHSPADRAADPRRRQAFAITVEGEAQLIAWVCRTVTRDDAVWRSQELLLRFAFMDSIVPRTVTLRFLDQLEAALSAYVGELRAEFRRSGSQIPLNTGLLALESGIEGMEAHLDWARRTRAQLSEVSR